MVPAEALNVPLVAPAATVTDPGTFRLVLSSERETKLPPAGAALFNVTVQLVAPPADTEVGLQARPLS